MKTNASRDVASNPDRHLPALVVALVLTWSLVAAAEEDPARDFKNSFDVLITVRDVKPLLPPLAQWMGAEEPDAKDAHKALFDKLGQVANGRACLAVRGLTEKTPVFLLRLPVDETKVKVDDLVEKDLVQVLGIEDPVIAKDAPIRQLGPRGKDAVLCWTVQKGVLYASNDRDLIRTAVFLPPVPPPGMTVSLIPDLADNQLYRDLGKHVDWTGDVTLFLNLKHLLPGKRVLSLLDMLQLACDWLKPEQFQALGFSWKGDGKGGSGRLALLTPKDRSGLAALLNVPNAPIEHLDRIPENVQFLVAVAPLWSSLVGHTEKFMAALDPDVAKEFTGELAEFNKELGADLDRDLLGNLGSLTAAARMPGAGALTLFQAASVKDPDRLQKSADALAAYNRTPLRTRNRDGRIYHLLPTDPITGYTFDGGLMYYSNTFEGIDEMLALANKPAPEGVRSLDQSERFRTLRTRLPRESILTAAADTQWAAQMTYVAAALAFGLKRDAPKADLGALGEALEPFDQGPGLSLGLALRNESDAFVVHLESLSGDLWRAAPGVFSFVVQQAYKPVERPPKPPPPPQPGK